MTSLALGRLVGALFLLAFLCYGIGGLLVTSVTSADDVLASVSAQEPRLTSGALLMLANSVVVVAIGVLVREVVRRYDALVATAYLVARGVEATVLAVGVVAVLVLVPVAAAPGADAALATALRAANDVGFQVAMLGLALGSVLLCRALLRYGLVPRWLAVGGVVGYATFGLGAALEILGMPVGVALAVPGGLFEVAFGIFLLRHGFPHGPDTGRQAPHIDRSHASAAAR